MRRLPVENDRSWRLPNLKQPLAHPQRKGAPSREADLRVLRAGKHVRPKPSDDRFEPTPTDATVCMNVNAAQKADLAKPPMHL